MVAPAPYPDEEDLRELADALDLLGVAGSPADPGGPDIETFAAVAYAHGWGYRIDRAAGGVGYRAELRPQRGALPQPVAFAIGWEPGVALALALAVAVKRTAAGTAAPGPSRLA
jgi:hypothetical protein